MVKLAGTTIQETISAFTKPNLGDNKSLATEDDRIKAIGRIVVSVLVAFLSAYLFSTGKDTVAGTLTGALTGYWLK